MDATGQVAAPPHEIYGFWDKGLSWEMLLAIALVALVFAAMGYWLWRRWHQTYKPKPQPSVTAVQQPAAPRYTRIIPEWQALAPRENITPEAMRDFFYQLSFLFREAWEIKSRVPLTAMTIKEAQVFLEKQAYLGSEDTKRALQFLRRADEVKFREQPAAFAEALQWHTEVGDWLRRLLKDEKGDA